MNSEQETKCCCSTMKFQAQVATRKVHFSENEDVAPVADISVGHEAPAVAEPAVESADTQSSGSAQRTRQAGRLAVRVCHAC